MPSIILPLNLRAGAVPSFPIAALATIAITLSASIAFASDIQPWQTTYESGGARVAIEGFLPGARTKAPVILLLHGTGGLEQATGEVFRNVALAMAQKGYIALIPHYFDRTGHMVGQPLAQADHAAHVAAVTDAINLLAAMPEVDADRFGIFGFSSGASMATQIAASDKRVRAITQCAAIVPSNVPTLFLLGSLDRGTDERSLKLTTDRMTDRDIPHASHTYRGERHGFRPLIFLDAGRRATSFFDKHLKGAVDLAALVDTKSAQAHKVTTSTAQYQSGNVPVTVECFIPEGNGTYPLVLIAHPESGLLPLQFEGLPGMARTIARKGNVVLLPHYWERTNHAKGKPVTEEERQAFVGALTDAIAFAETIPAADTTHIGFVGIATGADLALTSSAGNPNIRAFASCAAIPKSIPSIPSLLLVGSTDKSASKKAIDRFKSGMQDAKTPSASHVYAGLARQLRPAEYLDAGDRIARFFDAHLRDPAPAIEGLR